MKYVRIINEPRTLSSLLDGHHLLPGDVLAIQQVTQYYLSSSNDRYFVLDGEVQRYVVGGLGKEPECSGLPEETIVLTVDRSEGVCCG